MVDPAKLAADVIVERLRAWDVPRVFGHSGDGIDGMIGALRRAGGNPAFVPARHEETAAFMASGHAKYTGGVGVCLSTQGPGAVHLLNGLYDAKLDAQPVVAIVGRHSSSARGKVDRKEIDLTRLFGDVCAEFVQTASTAEQVPMLLDRALSTALATRSPTCLVLPHDVLTAPLAQPQPPDPGAMPAVLAERPALMVPSDQDLAAAADILNAGQRVAILVGQGGSAAGAEIFELAERLGAGVTTSLLGKPVLDERLPFHTGVIGHLGTTASVQLMSRCDTLLMIGTDNPWTEFYPAPGQARAVQIDIDGRRIGARYPVDVPLVGDAGRTLRALLSMVPRRKDRHWRNKVEGWVHRWRTVAADRAMAPADPVNPQFVLRELSPRLPAAAAVAVDVGSVTYWYARHLELRPGVPAHVSGTLASTGSALPYALAAKFAAPERPVIALTGDGAMQMNGLAELITVARCWRDWADPCFIVLVLNNRELAEVSWEQRETAGDPAFTDTQRLPDLPYTGWARLIGLHGVRVTRPDMVGPAWDEALAADRPTLIEAVVDPAIPLLPPDQPFDKIRKMYEELAQEGGSEAARAREHLLRERAGEGYDDPA